MATSHDSPAWTTPSPQVREQSGSWAAVQPAGQQPSEAPQAVMAVETQAAVQVVASPVSAVCRQAAGDGGQLVGHALEPVAIGSQVSPGSTTPSPQRAGQSLSVARVDPARQHPSPEMGAVIGMWTHSAWQALPESRSVVQGSPSSQLTGQLPL